MSVTASPPRSQQMDALARANRVRLARADLKRRIATGDLTAAAVILACPPEAHSMRVNDLLMSQRRWGQTRARRFLAQVPLSETKTIGSLTERQRRALAASLGGDPAASASFDVLRLTRDWSQCRVR